MGPLFEALNDIYTTCLVKLVCLLVFHYLV
jgi:hypothetical protein